MSNCSLLVAAIPGSSGILRTDSDQPQETSGHPLKGLLVTLKIVTNAMFNSKRTGEAYSARGGSMLMFSGGMNRLREIFQNVVRGECSRQKTRQRMMVPKAVTVPRRGLGPCRMAATRMDCCEPYGAHSRRLRSSHQALRGGVS